jgi:hypothetical protein
MTGRLESQAKTLVKSIDAKGSLFQRYGMHTSVDCWHQRRACFETPAFSGLLSMKEGVGGINNFPHGEERATTRSQA